MGMASRVWLAVLVCLVVAPLAVDAMALGPRGLEVNVGFADGEDEIGGTFILGALMDLGEIVPNLALEGGLDFWTKSYDFGMFGSKSEYRYTNIGVLAGARYDFPVPGTITPFAFSALGLHIARGSGSVTYTDPWSGMTMTEDDSSTKMKFGIRFGGGAAVSISPGIDFVGRVGYDINGGADYLFITAGARFALGQ